MIKGDPDELNQITKTHQCPEHPDLELTVAWHPDEFWVIRCGAGHYPEEITRRKTALQEHKAGEREAHQPLDELLPRVDLATGEVLQVEVVQGLMKYAYKYGLDPYRSHVALMYGKPYITIDGYLYHARKEGIAYQLNSRPLTTMERTDYQVPEGAHAWIAYVKIPETQGLFSGLGIVTIEEMEAKSKRDATKLASPVVAAHPWQLAQKRAEWQVLRRAFPIGEDNADNM